VNDKNSGFGNKSLQDKNSTGHDSAVSTPHQFFVRRSSLQEEKVKTIDAIPLWKSYDKAGS
jgi:hypothetical protein